jgi:hypothetical protein
MVTKTLGICFNLWKKSNVTHKSGILQILFAFPINAKNTPLCAIKNHASAKLSTKTA